MRGGRIMFGLLLGQIFCFSALGIVFAKNIKHHAIKKYPVSKKKHLSTLEVPAIVVRSTGHSSQNNTSIKGQTNVVTAKEIQNSGHQALGKLLQGRAGIQIRDLSGDYTKASISMRGFGDDASGNSLILLDGLPLRNPDLGAPSLSLVPVNDIDKIEIFPGSQSVLYGDQAVGGYVNIITKKPQKNERVARAFYGSYQAKQAGLTFSDLFRNGLGYRVSALSYESNNYRDHNKDRINSVNFLLGYYFDSGKLSLTYRKFNQHLLLPGELTLAQAHQDRRQAQDHVAFNNEDIDYWQFNFVKDVFVRWKLVLDADYQSMAGKGAYLYNQQAIDFDERRKVGQILPKLTGTFYLWNKPIFSVLGMEYGNSTYRIMSEKSKQEEKSAYGQIKIPLFKKLTGVLGVRYANATDWLDGSQNGDDHVTVSNLEFDWRLHSKTNLFIRRAGSYRFAKPEENYATLTGEPLKTQLGTSYEAGLKMKNNRLSLLVMGYRLDLKNEIMCIPVATERYAVRNQNLDPTRRIGALGEISYAVMHHWLISANYNAVDAKFSSGPYKGYRIPFVSQQTFRLSSTYRFLSHWKIFIEGLFSSNRYSINDVENRVSPLGGYSIYNVHLAYHRKHVEVGLEINNLTNKYYYNASVTTYQNGSINTGYYPAVGINALLSIKVIL